MSVDDFALSLISLYFYLQGAVHADDGYYWMGGFISEISIKDKKIVDEMGEFFSNFAKTGSVQVWVIYLHTLQLHLYEITIYLLRGFHLQFAL